jgi:hypothetical protein
MHRHACIGRLSNIDLSFLDLYVHLDLLPGGIVDLWDRGGGDVAGGLSQRGVDLGLTNLRRHLARADRDPPERRADRPGDSQGEYYAENPVGGAHLRQGVLGQLLGLAQHIHAPATPARQSRRSFSRRFTRPGAAQ